MSKEIISTAILVIAAVVAASAAVMVMMPTVRDLSLSYSSMASSLNKKVETDTKIVFVKAVDNVDNVSVNFWVKNTGSQELPQAELNNSDIFIYSDNEYLHFTVEDSKVSYEITNGDGDNDWEEGETINFCIEDIDSADLPSDEYTLSFVLYNGVESQDVFSF